MYSELLPNHSAFHVEAAPTSSFLFFPTVLCQIFGVCLKNPSATLMEGSMKNVTAMLGDTVEFRCKVGNLGKHMIAFFRDEIPPRLIAFDESIFRQHDKYELKPRVNADEWILKIKNVQETDIGNYICQLNTNPVFSMTGNLELKIPPTVSRSSTPSAVEVREGHNVTLSCHAEGNPKPTVVWRRADRQIIRYNGASGYGDSVYKGADLRLNRVSRKHMSEYVCIASNGIPPDESWTIKLHILFEPIVLPQAIIVEASLGSVARLVCNVESWPRPLVTWFLDDFELFDSNRFSTEQSVADRYKSVHVLEIKNVEKAQLGKYRCVASNDYGKHFAEMQLIEAPSIFTNILSEGASGEIDNEINFNDQSEDDEDFLIGESHQTKIFFWKPLTTTAHFGTTRRHSNLIKLSESQSRNHAIDMAKNNQQIIDKYRDLRHRKNAESFDSEESQDNSLPNGTHKELLLVTPFFGLLIFLSSLCNRFLLCVIL